MPLVFALPPRVKTLLLAVAMLPVGVRSSYRLRQTEGGTATPRDVIGVLIVEDDDAFAPAPPPGEALSLQAAPRPVPTGPT
jgi:hypothetical protein